MNAQTIGNPAQFAITYRFIDNSPETELSMFVDGKNILAFERGGEQLTTCWDLDELALWLRDFIDHLTEDPYPVEAEGEFAAEKDISAREFDTDDLHTFDAYYDNLDNWNLRHRWHPASAGAILADVYFQYTGDFIEISWNNTDEDEDIHFLNMRGGSQVPKDIFCDMIERFLQIYAQHRLISQSHSCSDL